MLSAFLAFSLKNHDQVVVPCPRKQGCLSFNTISSQLAIFRAQRGPSSARQASRPKTIANRNPQHSLLFIATPSTMELLSSSFAHASVGLSLPCHKER